jgi:hypothetical protein
MYQQNEHFQNYFIIHTSYESKIRPFRTFVFSTFRLECKRENHKSESGKMRTRTRDKSKYLHQNEKY